ncbi:MAG: hypothetical protein JETT_3802 [Candidatus Jettenia ecosi]|uniref:Uncharacterized protein n=1 Tax=Candidatus Jettenia ecosi TaxID=2494326 RepID=A0A533Q5V7_9BACT|nr:MAG: hypothetical protein JETT_3802 [Candidatus Jettenia ecosi]
MHGISVKHGQTIPVQCIQGHSLFMPPFHGKILNIKIEKCSLVQYCLMCYTEDILGR